MVAEDIVIVPLHCIRILFFAVYQYSAWSHNKVDKSLKTFRLNLRRTLRHLYLNFLRKIYKTCCRTVRYRTATTWPYPCDTTRLVPRSFLFSIFGVRFTGFSVDRCCCCCRFFLLCFRTSRPLFLRPS